MKCKSCGMDIEKNWNYCPNCSQKINKNKKLFIILSIIIFLAVKIYNTGIDIHETIEENAPIDESYGTHIKKNLSNKYNENFAEIQYVKEIKNPDTDLNCDGSSFGTIKGKGSKIYYKVYSQKNNLEFYAYYDTTDEEKNIYDTYTTNFNRRNVILKVYDFTEENFNNISFLTSYNDEQQYEITSKKQLKKYLSYLNDNILNENNDNILYKNSNDFEDNIYIKINEDIFEFAKENYNIIKKLNDEVEELRREYPFSMFLLFNDDAYIELEELRGKPYAYDNNETRGEVLEDFILRTDH